MPVRNGAPFLPKSIYDIETNTLDCDEILVVNDGSTDDTAKILNEWSKRNNKVRVLTTQGMGLVNALNLGVSEASNNWMARFDVDDGYSFNRITEQRKVISNSIAAIFCDYQFNDPKGNRLGVIPSAVNEHATALSLISSQRTPHPGVLLNRKDVLSVGGYRKEDFPAEDISLWLRLSNLGKITSVPQVLLYYRLSKQSISAQNRMSAKTRTSQLIKEIGISKDHIDYCLKEWHEVFNDYSKMSFSSERKLLFYRDLKKSVQIITYNDSSKKQLKEIEGYLLRDAGSYRALSYLLAGKMQRKIYRTI